MTSSRVARGRKTQELLAAYLRRHGWRQAASRPASLPGTDIMHTPGLAIEVKATGKLDATGALRQAARNAGDALPIVVHRPNSYGEARIDEWVVVLRLSDAVPLLRKWVDK